VRRLWRRRGEGAMDHKTAIICIAPDRWDGIWRNRQQVMSRLAGHYKVFFLEPRGTIIDYWFHKKEVQIKKINEYLFLIPIPCRLSLLSMFSRRKALKWITAASIAVSTIVRKIVARHRLRGLAIHNPVLWLYSPFDVGILGSFGEQLSVYHCYDEVALFPQNEPVRELIEGLDQSLVAQVDIVFASSQSQGEKRKPCNPLTFVVPNAADYRHFSRAATGAIKIPEALIGVPGPRLGFMGALNFNIDVKLLEYISESHPEWSLVLVGENDLSKYFPENNLGDRANIYFVGRHPVDALPEFMSAIDVGILPYRLAPNVLASMPLKFLEFLSAGKPVVSVNFPELVPFGDVVSIAHSYSEFVSLIEQELSSNSEEKKRRRKEIARRNTWDARVAEMMRVLDGAISTRQGVPHRQGQDHRGLR